MKRPDANRNTQVAGVMNLYGCDEDTAKKMLDFAKTAWDVGREVGRNECQRHLRLMLGIEEPETDERVYWNCPFPLKLDGG